MRLILSSPHHTQEGYMRLILPFSHTQEGYMHLIVPLSHPVVYPPPSHTPWYTRLPTNTPGIPSLRDTLRYTSMRDTLRYTLVYSFPKVYPGV